MKHIVRSHIRGWNPTGEKDKGKDLKPGQVVDIDPTNQEVAHLIRPGVLEPVEDVGEGEDAGGRDNTLNEHGLPLATDVDKANGKGGAADPSGANVTDDGKLKPDPAAEAAANAKGKK